MRIIMIFLIFTILPLSLLSAVTEKADPLAADRTALQYRTGKIDPVLEKIPEEIAVNIFIKPETYLKQLVAFLCQNADNEFHIVKRFHDWIADSIPYVFNAEIDIYRLLKVRRTNCSGYTFLFNAMAAMAGIRSEVVFGYSRTYRFANNTQGNHAWNVVTIDNRQYLVDITHDARQRAHGDSVGDKKPYTDDELFISPVYKILLNYPFDKKYQLLDTPVPYEKFMQLPQKRLAFIKYGLGFGSNEFTRQLFEAAYSWKGSNLIGIFDGIRTEGLAGMLLINCPQDVELKISVGDFSYTFNEHASAYRRGKYYIFRFSAPGKGSFLANIEARRISIQKTASRETGTEIIPGEKWERVYSFIIVEEKYKGPKAATK